MRKKLLALLMCATMVLGSSVVATAAPSDDDYKKYEHINQIDCGKGDVTKLYKNIDGNDPVTNQIINTKRIGIEFFIDDFGDDYKWSQIKYIDDIIMGYLTQMIPSTAILSINYILQERNDV